MMNKVLDLKTLSNLEQDQYPIGEVTLNVGEQTFLVKYQERFRDSEIQELIKEWSLINEATKEKIEVNMYDISFVLILKHFTDIPFDDIEDILERTEHYIRMVNLLVDLKDKDGMSLFEKVFSVIDKEQMLKVAKAMEKTSESILEQTEKLAQSEEHKKLREFVEANAK